MGGGASEEMITKGVEIILKDRRVKAILINIFGGILRCDVLARGVVAAAKQNNIRLPLIVRLEGTNVEEGRNILRDAELKFLVARDLAEAAELVAKTNFSEGLAMSILIDEKSRVVVQGITGREGAFHTKQMLDYGTVVAAGVTPGKGGQEMEGVPVFNTVEDAVTKAGANVSCIFVPPPFAADAIMEAASAGIGVIVCHYGRDSHYGHDACCQLFVEPRLGVDRPQLPRNHLSRQMQGGHHAGPNPQAGKNGGHFPKRHPHL